MNERGDEHIVTLSDTAGNQGCFEGESPLARVRPWDASNFLTMPLEVAAPYRSMYSEA